MFQCKTAATTTTTKNNNKQTKNLNETDKKPLQLSCVIGQKRTF